MCRRRPWARRVPAGVDQSLLLDSWSDPFWTPFVSLITQKGSWIKDIVPKAPRSGLLLRQLHMTPEALPLPEPAASLPRGDGVTSGLATSYDVLHTGGRDFCGWPGCRDPDTEIM